MADQSAGSPWDESLPENINNKKPVPTVFGDLDVNKQPANNTANNNSDMSNNDDKPVPDAGQKSLNVPTDSGEEVGARITISNPKPASAVDNPAGLVAPLSPINPAVQSTDSTKPSSQSTNVPVSNQKSAEPKVNPADFWRSVYENADQQPASQTSAAAQSQIVQSSISPNPTSQNPTQPKPQPSIPTTPTAPPQSSTFAISPTSNTQNSSAQTKPAAQSLPLPSQVPLKPASGATQTQPAPAVIPMKKSSKLTSIIWAAVLGIIILFAGGIFLTEEGIISVGLEKVYGFAHLELIWKGLPANAENAFVMSAAKMQSEKSFKVSGSATATVNKGVKSNIISPIVSAAVFPIIALKDEQVGSKISTILAAADNQASSSANPLFQDDSTSQSSTNANMATVEELTTNIGAQISDSVSGADINIKSSKSSNSEIQLLYSAQKLYLKSSSNIVYDDQAKGGWIVYNLNNLGSESPGASFWGSNFSGSNFSIIGSRQTSETINGVRCFHYVGTANIGDVLNNFGLNNSSVSTLDLEYWLGAKDHLIHRLIMKIIPGSSSAITRIDIALDFSDYGNDSSDYIIPATSTPASGSTSIGNGGGPSVAQTRDSQRKIDLASIAKALESYHAKENKYPKVSGTEKISNSSGVLYSALVPTYISKLPLDPNDPINYYGYESDGTTYKLSSVLEDKTDTSGTQVGGNYLYFLSSLQQ